MEPSGECGDKGRGGLGPEGATPGRQGARSFLPSECPACRAEDVAQQGSASQRLSALASARGSGSARGRSRAPSPAGVSAGRRQLVTERLCAECRRFAARAASARGRMRGSPADVSPRRCESQSDGATEASALASPETPEGFPAGVSAAPVRREGELGAEKESPGLGEKTPRHGLPCERTLGVHFARVALTHAPALPWECHLEELGAARRQEELESDGAPVDAATLRALTMAEEFTRMKRDEAVGACCACSAPIRPPLTETGNDQEKAETAKFPENHEARDWYSRGILDFEDMMKDMQHFLARDRRQAMGREKVHWERKPSQSEPSLGEVETRGSEEAPAATDGGNASSSVPPLVASSCLDANEGNASARRTLPQPHTELFSSSSSSSSSSASRLAEESEGGKRTKGGEKTRGAPLNLSEFYFYQAADGQLCFLHPFFVKCLLFEAGGDESRLPPVLLDVVVRDVQLLCVDEQVRRRFKCFAHLPQMAQVSFVDVDLRSVISPETARVFKEEFRRRAANRRERLRQEEREAVAAASSVASASSLSSRVRFVPREPLHPPTDCSPQTFPSLPGRDSSLVSAGSAGAASREDSSFSFAAVVKRQEEQQKRALERKRQEIQFPSLGAALPPNAGAVQDQSVARGWTQLKPGSTSAPVRTKTTAWGGGRHVPGRKETEATVEEAYLPRPGGCSLGEILLQAKTKKKREKKAKDGKTQDGKDN
ncbi:putative zinc finger (C3HC4 RING finger) protein [Neospora caninum Liverpool]|nr:putative zinc finger (C3HC4 RING finger) protein [Neospora caninum Liverpool]CBZ54643.1 putative zinc finger (C3HC4 RING finger) protein [Neospora caninum Liverpool]|eukprot:XP_003884673.1 putative zinc finger (C3HC4 RING finger) protein [Neospora caninum Liverpool]